MNKTNTAYAIIILLMVAGSIIWQTGSFGLKDQPCWQEVRATHQNNPTYKIAALLAIISFTVTALSFTYLHYLNTNE